MFIHRLDTAKERLSELKGILVETFKTEKQTEQTLKSLKRNKIYKDCGTTRYTRKNVIHT